MEQFQRLCLIINVVTHLLLLRMLGVGSYHNQPLECGRGFGAIFIALGRVGKLPRPSILSLLSCADDNTLFFRYHL